MPDAVPAKPPSPARLLFVCMGNICRSPAAEAMMNHLSRNLPAGQRPIAASAGTLGYHAGSAPDKRMREAASRRGITMTSKARQFQRADFDAYDLILTMDDDNLRNVLALAPNPAAAAKVVPMTRFSRTNPPATHVPDPYYGGPAGFEEVLDILHDCCGSLLASLSDPDPAGLDSSPLS